MVATHAGLLHIVEPFPALQFFNTAITTVQDTFSRAIGLIVNSSVSLEMFTVIVSLVFINIKTVSFVVKKCYE